MLQSHPWVEESHPAQIEGMATNDQKGASFCNFEVLEPKTFLVTLVAQFSFSEPTDPIIGP